MKILVLSDSLTLPRNAKVDQVLNLAETWPRMLAQKHPDWEFAVVGIGSATTEDILYQAQYWTGFDADHVLIQVGICDALPRALHLWEVELLKKLPGKQFWRKVVKRVSVPLRKYRGITLISESGFTLNISKIAAQLNNTSFLPILDDGQSPPHMPTAHRNVCRYNEILSETAGNTLVELGQVPASAFMSDHYHLNPSGHQLVVEAVERHILLR